jgi:pimeloyl-ACP methyl ester carboxylesterase
MEANWGTTHNIDLFAPSRSDDPEAQDYFIRCQTCSASPSAGAAFLRALAEIDVRGALPSITAPTLILHAQRDKATPIGAARVVRDLIPGARLVELDSDIHLLWLSDAIDTITDEIEAFLTRTVPAADVDRVVAATSAR